MEIIGTRPQIMEYFVTWKEIQTRVNTLKKIVKDGKTYGIPRGGQYISAMLNPVDTPEEADFIVDDLVDSGATRKRYMEKYPDKHFLPLFDKQIEPKYSKKWLIFPWEVKDEPVEDNIIRICQYYGFREVTTMDELMKLYENR